MRAGRWSSPTTPRCFRRPPRLRRVGARSGQRFSIDAARWTKAPSSRFASADRSTRSMRSRTACAVRWASITGSRCVPSISTSGQPRVAASRLRCVRLRGADNAASRVPGRHLRAVVEPRARQRGRLRTVCATSSAIVRCDDAYPTSSTRAASGRIREQRVDERRNSASAGATLPSDGGTRASMKISIAASVRAASDGSSSPAALCATGSVDLFRRADPQSRRPFATALDRSRRSQVWVPGTASRGLRALEPLVIARPRRRADCGSERGCASHALTRIATMRPVLAPMSLPVHRANRADSCGNARSLSRSNRT